MRQFNCYLVLVSLLFTASAAESAQLGSAKGSAVFGRPLDLSVQVRLDVPSEEAVNCFSADVFQADNKFDAGRIRLEVLPAANGVDATVRVRSITAISEPWAKVILRSNCGSKVSRQYDFLTDFATEIPSNNMLAEAGSSASTSAQPQAPTAALTTSPLATLNVPKSNQASSQAPVSNWTVKRSQAKAKSLQQKENAQVAIASRASRSKVTPADSIELQTKNTTDMVTDAVGQSRLKMETFALTDEHQVLLKLSAALIAPTGMRTPEEIQSLAQATAVWRAINGMPALTQAPMAPAAAEAQVKAPVVEKLPMSLPTLMNQKLAGKSEFSNLMVYGLVGLLALTLGCVVWLWLRVRKATRAGYGWLNDSVTNESNENDIAKEQAQLSPVNFQENQAIAQTTQTAQEPIFYAEPEPEPMPEPEPVPEPVPEPEPVPVPISASEPEKEPEIVNKASEDTNKNKVSPTARPETPVSDPLPIHFEDSRFGERVLRVKKKVLDFSHEKPISSSAELMDLVLADTQPKLRNVTVPAPIPAPVAEQQLEKLNTAVVKKTATTKDDSKSNLIDFDVFAEPEPLNKPTRFVR